mmetsp:Transcript_4724/g.7205  ORF Transcript_4724/g.7205 Transcript_4724/m.7205 type:complete len:443 (-) Transcript_4724:60-1388(-)
MSSISFKDCVTQLKGMFPKIGEDVIKLVLESNALNIDDTIAALLGMNETASGGIPKSSLRMLYRKKAELTLEMKKAATKEDYSSAASKKAAIKACEKEIKKNLELGHKAEEKTVSLYVDENGKAGFDFKYHPGGWDVGSISNTPGQPDLISGDRIIEVGGVSFIEQEFKIQLAQWKKCGKETKFSGKILRFTDANSSKTEVENKEGKAKVSDSKAVGGSDVKTKGGSEAKRTPETEEDTRVKILTSLQAGVVPDDFLRPPMFFKTKGSTKHRSQLEQDEHLARLLQDELFMAELRANPDAFLDAQRGGSSRQARPTQGRRTQDKKEKSKDPAGPAPDLSSQGSKEAKVTFGQRMSKLGDAARKRLGKVALFFKRKKKSQQSDDQPVEELVPLAEQADKLPLAPDHGGGASNDAFVIESDDDLGVGAGQDSPGMSILRNDPEK